MCGDAAQMQHTNPNIIKPYNPCKCWTVHPGWATPTKAPELCTPWPSQDTSGYSAFCADPCTWALAALAAAVAARCGGSDVAVR